MTRKKRKSIPNNFSIIKERNKFSTETITYANCQCIVLFFFHEIIIQANVTWFSYILSICSMCCVMFRLKKYFHHACRAFLTNSDIVFGCDDPTHNPSSVRILSLLTQFSGLTTLQSLVSGEALQGGLT